MKNIFLIAIVLFLGACSSLSGDTQINFDPDVTLSEEKLNSDISFTLTSQDERSAQYIAIIEEEGQEQIQPLHSAQNVRSVYEGAIYQQLYSQGFYATRNSNNIININVVETLARVQQNTMDHQITAKVTIQITAETPNGKFVKNFYTSGFESAPLKASASDIEKILNNLATNVMHAIATDAELKSYIMDNF